MICNFINLLIYIIRDIINIGDIMAYKGPKGRNISNENLREIFNFIDNFKPTNEVEERDLAILKYAYEKDLSAESISKLDDPKLIGYSNNNHGNRLTRK